MQVDLSTGFPVPLGYRSSEPAHPQNWLSWRDQRHGDLPLEPRTAHQAQQEHGEATFQVHSLMLAASIKGATPSLAERRREVHRTYDTQICMLADQV